MKRTLTLTWGLMFLPALCVLPTVALANTIPVGFVSWDVNIPGSAGSFDIINQTGPNSSVFPDTTFPITTTLAFSDLALSVDFVGGGHTVFGSGYFTVSLDGISFDGGVIPIDSANPLPTTATLTGTLSPLTIALNDGSILSSLASFSATLIAPGCPPLCGTGLSDGDFAVIYATTTSVPEPGTLILLGGGLAGLFSVGRKK